MRKIFKSSARASGVAFAVGAMIVTSLHGRMALGQAYVETNLDSTTGSNVAAQLHDPRVVNSWGISFQRSGTGGFWVAENGAGLGTVISPTAGVAITPSYTILPPASTPAASATPTGVVPNTTSSFSAGSGLEANVIFDTEDGTISAYNATNAVLEVDNSSAGAVYTGLAIGSNGTQNLLYAPNFHSGNVDVFGAGYAPTSLAGTFTDPNLPAGYAPFGIQTIGGDLYVTYAQQNSAKNFPVSGAGDGVVAEFDPNGNFLKTIGTGGTLNAPWGLALAPANFGPFSSDLLVTNHGDGTIDAFNLTTDAYAGQLSNAGGPLSIDGLWGLSFGNGSTGSPTNTLFFTAGPENQTVGLFGSVTGPGTVPEPTSISLLAVGMFGLLRRRRGRG